MGRGIDERGAQEVLGLDHHFPSAQLRAQLLIARSGLRDELR